MNAILFSAVWGVVMMFAGLRVRNAGRVRAWGLAGFAGLLLVTFLELKGVYLLHYNLNGMLRINQFF